MWQSSNEFYRALETRTNFNTSQFLPHKARLQIVTIRHFIATLPTRQQVYEEHTNGLVDVDLFGRQYQASVHLWSPGHPVPSSNAGRN